jgi:hypothetical protein
MIGRGIKCLPKEAIPLATKNGIIQMVAITLGIVLVINVVIYIYLINFTPDKGILLMRAKWAKLSELKDPVKLLILGDSTGNQGVDPKIIRDKLHVSAINLCTIGYATVLNDAWMLEDYIKRFGAPKTVLLVHAYDVWSRDINLSVLSQIPGSFWKRTPNLRMSLKDRARIFFYRYVPLYSEQESLAYILQNPWTIFRRNLHLEADGYMRESKPNYQDVQRELKEHMEFVHTRIHPVSQINVLALEWIRGLAEANKMEVFIANGPVYQDLFADSGFQIFYAKLRAAILDISARGKMHLLLDPPKTFPIEVMQSVDHLISTAAEEYTIQIIEGIKAIENSSMAMSDRKS